MGPVSKDVILSRTSISCRRANGPYPPPTFQLGALIRLPVTGVGLNRRRSLVAANRTQYV